MPTPEPTATPEPTLEPLPTPRNLTRREAEDELLSKASSFECERWREENDQPIRAGAKGAIWCGTPANRVQQLALYTFLDDAALEGYWPQRLRRIQPTPPETASACDGGVAGVRPWGRGDIVCYVQDDVAKIRWTDQRTGLYGVADATDDDLQRLYNWWRSNARPMGRPEDGGGNQATPSPDQASPAPGETDQPGGFVCGPTDAIFDPLDRRWRIDQVSFRRGGGIERVIFQLQRNGDGSPIETTVDVGVVSLADPDMWVDTQVEPPNVGDSALIVRFGPNIRDVTGLSHYEPRGVEIIQDLSMDRLASGYSLSTIGVTGEGCYRLSVPGFADPRPNASTIEVFLDIRP